MKDMKSVRTYDMVTPAIGLFHLINIIPSLSKKITNVSIIDWRAFILKMNYHVLLTFKFKWSDSEFIRYIQQNRILIFIECKLLPELELTYIIRNFVTVCIGIQDFQVFYVCYFTCISCFHFQVTKLWHTVN